MRTEELGREVRRLRGAHDLTQAELARAAGISRTTLNLFENGVVPDLGIRKVQALLDRLGLALGVEAISRDRRRDFVRLACATASVSFRTALAQEELIRALLTGKVPAGKQPHLRALFEEAAPAVLKGLMAQVSRWGKPGKVERNAAKLAAAVGVPPSKLEWLKSS